MSDLDDIVRIVLTRESTAVATASFQIPLVLATFTNFAERTRTYTSFASVAGDFDSAEAVYKIAQKLFGQSTVGAVPPSIVVGRRQVDSVTGSIVTVSNSTAYTLTINDKVYSFTSGSSATAVQIVTGLKSAYDLSPMSGITFTDDLAGAFAIAVTTPGTGWSIKASANVALANVTPTETYVDALDAVSEDNDSWYALISDSQDKAVQEALSDAISAQRKLYGISSSDAVAPTTTETDIGAILNAKSAGRTFGVYLPTAASDYPEAAWIGSQLAYTPGSNDWDFKRASGVTVSKLNSTATTNLKEKNWNYYIPKGDVNIFMNGDLFDGTPIDQYKVA